MHLIRVKRVEPMLNAFATRGENREKRNEQVKRGGMKEGRGTGRQERGEIRTHLLDYMP